jgi:type IV pilus assembly protein PilZ
VTPDRVPVVFPVRFAAGGQAIQTTTREVSVEGVFVRSLQPPQEGSVISLRLYLPGNAEPDDVRGRVRGVRSEPDSGFWADFVELPEDVLDRIKQLLQRRARAAAGGPATPIGAIQLKPAELPVPPESRRAFPRHAARFQVGFATLQDFVLEYAANISAGGVFVQTEQPPEIDTVVSVSLRLPGNADAVEAKALIVHRVSKEEAALTGAIPGMGVQFLDSSDQFRAAIDQAIDYILKNG